MFLSHKINPAGMKVWQQLALWIASHVLREFEHKYGIDDANDEAVSLDLSEFPTRHAEVATTRIEQRLGPAYTVVGGGGKVAISLSDEAPKGKGKK